MDGTLSRDTLLLAKRSIIAQIGAYCSQQMTAPDPNFDATLAAAHAALSELTEALMAAERDTSNR